MQVRTWLFGLLCCTLLFGHVPALAHEGGAPAAATAGEQRSELTGDETTANQADPAQMADGDEVIVAATGAELAAALDVASEVLVRATVSGPAQGNSVRSNLGVIRPREGTSFVLLSTGVAGTAAPEQGTDFGPTGPLRNANGGGAAGDQVLLSIQLNIPEGQHQVQFDYRFLTAEYPEFALYAANRAFNDTFTAVVRDSAGVREVARAAVYNSALVPASASLAGGSGFDIFTFNPFAIGGPFTFGIPDAALTNFMTADFTVTGGATPVTIDFAIADRGDGFVDSAVILDGLLTSSLEAVDPNPGFLANGSVVNNAERLAIGGARVVGAAADGVTRVLLRDSLPGPGTVEFCLSSGTAPQDGGLALPGGTGRNRCVTAQAATTSRGYRAYAVYQVPDEFNRGTDTNLRERAIEFQATYNPTNGPTVVSKLPFTIVRPPVVLIHGLWSSRASWSFPLIRDSRFIVELADYEPTNAARFTTNQNVPGVYILNAIRRLRQQGIAATQADVGGHSMGGILSRYYARLNTYRRNDNYNDGDINKLITINTPHTGSPLANLLVSIRGLPFGLGGWIAGKAADAGYAIDQGATDDLSTGSSALRAIPRTQIPSHAMVGVGGSDALEILPGIGTLYTIINFFADFSTLFQGLQHDGIVGRQSQEGGMSSQSYTVIDGLESIHTSTNSSTTYSNRIIQLLNTAASSSTFAEFPAVADLALADQTTIARSIQPVASVAQDGVRITAPLSGTIVRPGATVNVTVEVASGVTVTEVLLADSDFAVVDSAAPFTFAITIPTDWIGEFVIGAAGKDDAGNYALSQDVSLQVQPTAELQTITVWPREIISYSIGEVFDLIAIGTYADDVDRYISTSDTGTTYRSADPAVASVSAEGFVTIEGLGTTTVVVSNSTVQDSITVRVLAENFAPIADAGSDLTANPNDVVTLDAGQSFDLDEGPQNLTYEWIQIDGPAITLTNALSTTASFTPTEESTYIFGLVVRDGQGNSEPDTVVVTTDPAAIDLASFTAVRTTGGISVSWTTSREIDTMGFHLLRSTDGNRANAQRITTNIITATGQNQGGASYTWLDTTADPATTYTYWLEETATDGTVLVYGTPAAVANNRYTIYLPMIQQ